MPLLDALLSGISTDTLKSGLESREQGAAEQLSGLLNQWLSFGLLREVPAKSSVADPAVFDAILAAGTQFHFQSHSDLAEMIKADPIHDLDPVTGKQRA